MGTRAKKNCTTYEPSGEYKGRGRRPIHGASVHIQELFTFNASSFKEVKLPMYGMEKQVCYVSCIYLWEQKLYQHLQFVLVNDGNKPIILVSTDLTMSAEEVIIAYAYRFKIEAMFREFKLHCGGLFYLPALPWVLRKCFVLSMKEILKYLHIVIFVLHPGR